MAGRRPTTPTDSGQPDDWDDREPTEVVPRSTLIEGLAVAPSPSKGIQSLVDETDGSAGERTEQYEALSERGEPHVGAVLPNFLEAQLDVVSGPDAPSAFRLTMTGTVIGRGLSADVRVHDSKASKRHAIITYSGSEFRIRDEKSTNGTFLNGSKVSEYAIRDGDKLLIGDTLLRFRLVRQS